MDFTYNNYQWSHNTVHISTHLATSMKADASLMKSSLKDLLLPLYVIDRSKEVAENPNFELTKADVLAFEEEYGKVEPGAFVAFRSDWSHRWPDQDAVRNLDENDVQHTPGWAKDALEFLIHERHVKDCRSRNN